MFEDDARDALIRYLGYSVKQPEAPVEEAPVEEVPAVESTITAEDLFAASSLPVIQPTVTPQEETPAASQEESVDWQTELKESVIVGDFASAVATCFKYKQFADALVIAAWGGPQLMEETTVRVG